MSTCPQCHSRFECGVVDTNQPASCWCMALPRIPVSTSSEPAAKTMIPPFTPSAINRLKESDHTSCLCPACLNAVRSAPPANL